MMPSASGAQDERNPGPGGTPISPAEAQPNPNEGALMLVRDLIRTTRMLAQRYPAAAGEVRDIQNSVQRIMQKVMASSPAPEPMAPPV